MRTLVLLSALLATAYADGAGIPIAAQRSKRGLLHYPATSSQSRFQLHRGAKIVEELHVPLYYPTLHVAPAAVHQPVALLRKKRDILAPAVPVVEQLPVSTSSQSRFQVHNGAKFVEETVAPAVAVAQEARPAVAVPVVEEARAVIAPIVESLPVASSSQSRYQLHNGAKFVEQLHSPVLYPAGLRYVYQPVFAAPAPQLFAPQPAFPSQQQQQQQPNGPSDSESVSIESAASQ